MQQITVKKATGLSRDLAALVKNDFLPDIIVAIKEGGVLPGLEISKVFGKPLLTISIGRVSEREFDEAYERATEKEREEISKKFDEAWFRTDPKLFAGLTADVKGKNILLVDDAVHTGKTLDVARSYLATLEPSAIKTAALFYAGNVAPDYGLGAGERKYPWSTWAQFSPEYEDYARYLQENGSLLS